MTHSLPSANTSGSSRRRSAAASAVPETSATNVVDTAAPAKRPRGRPKKIRPAPTTIADTPLDAPSSPLSSALSEASLTPEAESEVGDAHEVGPVEVDVSVTLGKKRKIAETGIASSEQAEDAGGVPDENEPERKTPKITLKRGQGGRFARQDAKGKEGVVGKTTGQDGRGSVAPPEQPVQPVQGASSRSRRSTVAQKVLGFDDGEDITPMASDEDDVVDQGDAADTSPSRIKSKEGGRTSLGTAAVGTEGEEADPFPPNTLGMSTFFLCTLIESGSCAEGRADMQYGHARHLSPISPLKSLIIRTKQKRYRVMYGRFSRKERKRERGSCGSLIARRRMRGWPRRGWICWVKMIVSLPFCIIYVDKKEVGCGTKRGEGGML